jgi:hypothetical protein
MTLYVTIEAITPLWLQPATQEEGRRGFLVIKAGTVRPTYSLQALGWLSLALYINPSLYKPTLPQDSPSSLVLVCS